MPLTALKGMNLPEIGTGDELSVTLCQYGTEPAGQVNVMLDAV